MTLANPKQTLFKTTMKVNKTRNKEVTKLYLSSESMKNKGRIINIMVFTIVLFITVLMISQIV